MQLSFLFFDMKHLKLSSRNFHSLFFRFFETALLNVSSLEKHFREQNVFYRFIQFHSAFASNIYLWPIHELQKSSSMYLWCYELYLKKNIFAAHQNKDRSISFQFRLINMYFYIPGAWKCVNIIGGPKWSFFVQYIRFSFVLREKSMSLSTLIFSCAPLKMLIYKLERYPDKKIGSLRRNVPCIVGDRLCYSFSYEKYGLKEGLCK